MKQNWLEWLNWKDEKSCSWAISYCVKKQLPGTAIANPATASSEELRRIIQNWPARKPENAPPSPGREELMKEEHRMRNAYAQWIKRRKASSHKNYTLWMSKSINKKLHKYAKEYHLSISATVQLLLEDFHSEIKRIEEEHKKKRQEQQEAHKKQQNDLKDRIKQQEKTITALRTKLNKPAKKASQSSAVTRLKIPIVKRRPRTVKLNTPGDEDH